MGELIGKSVKSAVKEALKLQTGLSPQQQHNMLKRVDRFGITEESLWQEFRKNSDVLSRADFSDRLFHISGDSNLVVSVSLYVHLLDQLMWDLITPQEAADMGNKILGIMKRKHCTETQEYSDKDTTAIEMIEKLKRTINEFIIV